MRATALLLAGCLLSLLTVASMPAKDKDKDSPAKGKDKEGVAKLKTQIIGKWTVVEEGTEPATTGKDKKKDKASTTSKDKPASGGDKVGFEFLKDGKVKLNVVIPNKASLSVEGKYVLIDDKLEIEFNVDDSAVIRESFKVAIAKDVMTLTDPDDNSSRKFKKEKAATTKKKTPSDK